MAKEQKKVVEEEEQEGFFQRTINSWIGLIKNWDDIYDEYVNKKNPNRILPKNHKAYLDNNFLYSGTNRVSAFYLVDELPKQMEIGFHQSLRQIIPLGVSLNFLELDDPYYIDWDDAGVKMRLKILEEVSVANQEEQESTTAYTGHKYQKKNEHDEALIQSIEYVQFATLNSNTQRKLSEYKCLIVLTGERGQDLEDALMMFENYIEKRSGMKVLRITSTIADVIRKHSPFGMINVAGKKRRFDGMLTSDEIRSRYHSFEQGVTGFGNVYLGTNIDTNSPVFKTFKRSVTDAEIVTVLGASDSGKSYEVKQITAQLMAFDNIVMTVNDYEGGEYQQLETLIDESQTVVTLDFNRGSGRYLDPVALLPTGVADIDKDMFAIANENTKSLFLAIATDEDLSNNKWIKVIINNGIDAFYSSLGVKRDDPDTWEATLDKDIYDVYNFLLQYTPSNTSDIEEFERQRAYFEESFAPYLDKSRKVTNHFTEPVSFKELAEAKLVLCNYNMRGIAAESLSELDSIMVSLNASTIAYFRTIYPYANGKYNIKIWEELPRFAQHRNATSLIKTHIVGGRKMGDINIIATNDPRSLMENDPFALSDNSNLVLIGKIGSKPTRDLVAKAFDMMDLIDEIDAIGNVVDDLDALSVSYDEIKMNPYKKAFVARLDTGDRVVIKANLPRAISETPLFKTGVNKKKAP